MAKSDGTEAKPKYIERLLLCEGYEDSVLFKRLIEVFEIPRFTVIFANGKDKFDRALYNFQVERQKHWVNLTDVVIAGDNDDACEDNFKNICKQIAKVEGLKAPSEPLIKSNSKPACSVLMIPWKDEEGNLECLCKDAARGAHSATGQHVDTFLDLVHAGNWGSASRHGKAWLRSNLAVRCMDPFVTLGDALSDHPNLIPIEKKYAGFKRISEFLAAI